MKNKGFAMLLVVWSFFGFAADGLAEGSGVIAENPDRGERHRVWRVEAGEVLPGDGRE